MGDELKSVGVFGATGLIGHALCGRLAGRGARVVRFSRSPRPGEGDWRTVGTFPELGGLDAVVNLAGESIAQRWTAGAWRRIHDSRVEFTRRIVESMGRMEDEERPKVLVNASAMGIYAPAGDDPIEESGTTGQGRLAELCREWEKAAREAERLGVRVVLLRTGIVLGKGGEAWGRLRRLFGRGLGGRLGSGRQWMPWIHLEDEAAAIEFALENEEVCGPLNLCAPEPVTNGEFTRLLAHAVGRPAVFHAPGLALKLILGGFGASLLASHRMVPARLQELGFEFRYRELGAALAELLAGGAGGAGD